MSPVAAAPAVIPPRKVVGLATVGKPSVVAIVLAVLATALQVVNGVVLTSSPQWQAVITVVLIFLAGEAISPLTPGVLATLIHVPKWLGTLLTALGAALAATIQLIHMTETAHVIVLAVLTFLVALGFGGSGEVPVPVAVP